MLEDLGKDFVVVNYTKELFSETTLKKLIGMLNIKPIELVRKNEPIWKIEFKGKELSDSQIIEAMVTYPKLIERPIVVNGTNAAIGRPMEAVNKIL